MDAEMGYPDLRLCKVLGKLLSWPTFKARPTDAARFLGPLVEKERRRIDLTNKRRVLSLERIQLSQKSTRNQPEINQSVGNFGLLPALGKAHTGVDWGCKPCNVGGLDLSKFCWRHPKYLLSLEAQV